MSILSILNTMKDPNLYPNYKYNSKAMKRDRSHRTMPHFFLGLWGITFLLFSADLNVGLSSFKGLS